MFKKLVSVSFELVKKIQVRKSNSIVFHIFYDFLVISRFYVSLSLKHPDIYKIRHFNCINSSLYLISILIEYSVWILCHILIQPELCAHFFSLTYIFLITQQELGNQFPKYKSLQIL